MKGVASITESLDPFTRAVLEKCRDGVLRVPACDDCGNLFLPAAPSCPHCWSRRLSPQPVSGVGSVETYAIYRRTYDPTIPAPYVVALIQLAEGPRLLSRLLLDDPSAARCGMKVRVRFESVGDLPLPFFAAASDERASKDREEIR